ncbi:hypothetical protein DPMN_170176 [Dreissena polymorpha]|uniref:Uncharacterized protein n=1 Tax=Dreissena polymorpha TaxID=45954 RepID=A0A9D4DVX1_DREPO|nr:hypothetical protein DPMN_170176 [Dreissena polymorpha]
MIDYLAEKNKSQLAYKEEAEDAIVFKEDGSTVPLWLAELSRSGNTFTAAKVCGIVVSPQMSVPLDTLATGGSQQTKTVSANCSEYARSMASEDRGGGVKNLGSIGKGETVQSCRTIRDSPWLPKIAEEVSKISEALAKERLSKSRAKYKSSKDAWC